MSDAKNLLIDIDAGFAAWRHRAVKIVEAEARKILDSDPDVWEFVMGMGGAFFVCKKDGKYDADTFTDEEYESDRYRADRSGIMYDFAEDFFKMIEDFDEHLNITGLLPMRFESGGPTITHW